jgi:hypothetical protein
MERHQKGDKRDGKQHVWKYVDKQKQELYQVVNGYVDHDVQ